MSQDSLIFNGKKYISSRRASEITGYTTDYIGQLARGGKISSRMIGRNRFVDENALLEYKSNFNPATELAGLTRSFEHYQGSQNKETVLSEPKSDQMDSSSYQNDTESMNQNISYRRDSAKKPTLTKDEGFKTKINFIAALTAVILLGVFLNTKPGAQGFKSFSDSLIEISFSEDRVNQSAMVAKTGVLDFLNEVDSVFLGYLDGIDKQISLYSEIMRSKILELLNAKPAQVNVGNPASLTKTKSDQGSQAIEFKVDDEKLKQYVREIMLSERDTFAPGGPYGGLVVLPSSGDPKQDEIIKQRIKDSFSDQVTVQFDTSGSSGVIKPVFKSGQSADENYMFLLVPVNK